jgi:integrase
LTTLAGLRPEEAANTTWDNILLDGDAPLVRVEAQTSKIRQRRIVYLHPTATAWLRHAKKKRAELPLVYQPRRRAQMAIRKVLGFEKWPQDITRHTAASYWLANTQDAASLAESLGHSVDVLKRHYRAIVTKEEAQRFWSITPETLSASATVHVDFVAAAIAGAGVG